jgi:hypothetical protein
MMSSQLPLVGGTGMMQDPPAISNDYYNRILDEVKVTHRNDAPLPHYNSREKWVVTQGVDGARETLDEMNKNPTSRGVNGYAPITGPAVPLPTDRASLEGYVNQTLEHELGHSFANPNTIKTPYIFDSEQLGHLGKPVELMNGLGKVQRETYAQRGSRFTEPEFTQFIKSASTGPNPESAIQGYSEEAKRVLRALINGGRQGAKGPETLLPIAARLIPGLVQNAPSMQNPV